MARVEFTPKVAQEICDWIASGGSVSAYCRQPGKIAKSAIFRRLATDEAFAAAYAQACQARPHAYADEIVDIADTEADPVKARNRISARQWFAANPGTDLELFERWASWLDRNERRRGALLGDVLDNWVKPLAYLYAQSEPAAPPPARFTFCAVASPIYWDDADTDETIRQVKAHNATWVALCQQ